MCGVGEEDEDEDSIADERHWMKCDKCGQWYHADCLGLDADDETSMYYE